MSVSGRFLGILSTFLVVVAAGEAQSRREPAKTASDLVRRSAPNFEADAAIHGTAKSLKALRGRVVLVEFWAVWCPHCVKTYDDLEALQKDYGERGLEVVGITSYYRRYDFDKGAGRLKRASKSLTAKQERQMVKDFADHHDMGYRLMMLEPKEWTKASRAYHARTLPSLYLIDRLGVVRWVRVGSGDYFGELSDEIEKLLKEQ